MTAAPTNASMAMARVVVDELARAGVIEACLAPGSRSAPLALALHAESRIRLHVRIDERSAAFCALGLARVSGRPVPVVCTSGTAAANFHPAVLEADQSRVPLLILTADRPPELRGTGANQTTDQLKLYGDAVRWFCDVGVAEDRPGAPQAWRAVVARAVAAATVSPTGPVHLNLGFREPLVPGAGHPYRAATHGREGNGPWTAVASTSHRPGDAEVERLTELVAAERGLLVVGDPPPGLDAGPILDLAAAAGWPVVAEPTSGARHGPLVVSTAALLLADDAFARAHAPDVVVQVGRPVLSRAVLALLRRAARHVLIDPDGLWLDPERTMTDLIVADPGALAAAVAESVSPRGLDGAWASAWRDAEGRARAAVDRLLDGEGGLAEQRLARDLVAGLPDGALLVAASSLPIRHLDTCMAPRSGVRIVGNRGVSGIDGFCSTAVGAALAHATRGPAFALAGDLSILHDASGLLLGPAEQRPDLVVVVLNNEGGGIFSLLPHADQVDAEAFERLFGTPHGADLASLAAAYGVGHRRLERTAHLPDILEAAMADGGIQLVEARTDRTHTADLARRLRQAAAAAVA